MNCIHCGSSLDETKAPFAAHDPGPCREMLAGQLVAMTARYDAIYRLLMRQSSIRNMALVHMRRAINRLHNGRLESADDEIRSAIFTIKSEGESE